MCIDFIIPGPPVGKQRHRNGNVSYAKRIPIIYTPKKTVEYEKHVGICAWEARIKSNSNIWPTPKGLELVAEICIHYGKTRGRKPDKDNVVKSVLDGMEGVLYENDKDIIPRVMKITYRNNKPYVKVRLCEAILGQDIERINK